VIQALVPSWRDVSASEVDLDELRGGVTNKSA
jgi:hypothetical protein